MKVDVQVSVGDQVGVGMGKIHAGEVAPDHEAGLAEAVESHMVGVDPNVPSCCIDGRHCVHTMHGTATEPRASVAGGALTTAFAGAELAGWFGDDTSNTQQRLGRVNRLLRAAGIKPGTHVDEAGVANEFVDPVTGLPATGCGAADKFPIIMQTVHEQAGTVHELTAAILGDGYQAEALQLAPTVNTERFADWRPTDIVDACGNDTENNVEILESDDTPTHGHREIAVVVNYRENTTLDRDVFVDDTGEQVFVVDMWYIDKLAKTLATGPKADEQYQQLRHAMVAYQVATYLALCDGSQRLITVH